MTSFETVECRRAVRELPPYLRDVLRGMADGKPRKQIAAELHITENTMDAYCARLYAEIGVNCVAQAVVVAIKAEM